MSETPETAPRQIWVLWSELPLHRRYGLLYKSRMLNGIYEVELHKLTPYSEIGVRDWDVFVKVYSLNRDIFFYCGHLVWALINTECIDSSPADLWWH